MLLVKIAIPDLDSLSDEQLQKEIAPGKNRGIYILGHLIAVHDDMLAILNWAEAAISGIFETIC